MREDEVSHAEEPQSLFSHWASLCVPSPNVIALN
ncbi:unnamed protein product [Spirodela intermedia]|uniref:Uncharacterized protein n=1 Tax=Spirodela intermedia TaxID=51605 RepID=A0ABN7ED18_SPIIN|nr:unnamed protein product [Spirodela intermedia]